MATLGEPAQGRSQRAGVRRRVAPSSTARSTMISAASRSSALRSSSSLRPSGTLRRAVARNISTPVNGSPSRPLMNSSMLTPRRVSACVTSRTMPGRSLPTISSVTTRCGFSDSAAAPRSTETRRPEGASFASADSSGMRFSSGTRTSTTPANLPASRTERLSSQVPPKSTTFSEIALTSPGLSSPTKVRTSDVVMGGPPCGSGSLSILRSRRPSAIAKRAGLDALPPRRDRRRLDEPSPSPRTPAPALQVSLAVSDDVESDPAIQRIALRAPFASRFRGFSKTCGAICRVGCLAPYHRSILARAGSRRGLSGSILAALDAFSFNEGSVSPISGFL